VLWGLAPFVVGWLLSPLAWSLAGLPWVWWLVAALTRGAAPGAGAARPHGWFMGAG
jgi:hypothetical protein